MLLVKEVWGEFKFSTTSLKQSECDIMKCFYHSFRESILQEAASKNQEFQATSRSLSSFLNSLPTNQISYNDDVSQVAAKQSSQDVRSSFDY